MIFISHKIYQALEKGDDICFISLDASAAFDHVWHAGLLFKLKCKGITGKLYDWIKSYLSDHFQRVVIKGQFSEWIKILAGVPQGSILGPLLVLVYIDDVLKDIECEMFMYADDTSMMEVITDSILSFEKINRDLNKLHIWLQQWWANFNHNKTKYIICSKKIQHPVYPNLYINNDKLH